MTHTGDGATKLNIITNQKVVVESNEHQFRFGTGGGVNAIDIHPHQAWIAWGTEFGYLIIYNLISLRGLQQLEITDSTPPAPRRSIADVSWNGNGDFIAAISRDGELYVANLTTGEVETVLNVTGELYAVDWNSVSNEIIYSGVSETGQPILEIIDVTGFAGVPPISSIILTQSDTSTTVAESGATDTYTLALGTQPTADVVITIIGTPQVTVSPATLTFTPENWDIAQTVTVSAVDDSDIEGAHTAVVTHSVVSADVGYNGIAVADVTVTITDNDEPTATHTDTNTHQSPNSNAR